MTTARNTAPELTPELLESFQRIMSDFQARADQLSAAYARMQDDFSKVNIELDRKNAELKASLARQEEMQTYLDSILQSMENGVIGVDIGGVVTHFNRAAAETTGFTTTEVLGKRYVDAFTGDAGSVPELLRVLHESNANARYNERVVWHRDGHPVPVSFHHALLRDKSGHKLGAVEVFSDISKIKALEEEMLQTRTMAALGEMSATVAHEIRNPLGAMGMWVALLERDFEENDPRRTTLGKIAEGLSRLNKIVSNLLVFTRPVKPEFRKVDLATVTLEIIDFVRIEIDRLGYKIAVVTTEPGSPLFALADPEKISQALLNLCLNAVQAMPGGGELRVGAVDGGKGYIVLTIEDDGCGIAAADIGKIFDPFFTTKENGTGLGLAIVKKFIESHSGYIVVDSVATEGTVVKVYIPQMKE